MHLYKYNDNKYRMNSDDKIRETMSCFDRDTS